MVNNFQRVGSVSNAHVGKDFEVATREYFRQQGIPLQRNYQVLVGLSSKKPHKFDLGSGDPPVLVECKSHTWTGGNNVPSAKMAFWNQAMYYFQVTPEGFRKVLFVLRDFSERRNETLAEYYVRTYAHLIPDDVEVLEYDGREPANRLR